MPEHLEISITGQFSLRAAAEFGFGPTEGRPPRYDGTIRLAFPVDGGRGYAGAVLSRPDPDGPVQVELTLRDGAEPEPALAQVARVVSLDHDGAAFARVGEADPVIGALQRAHPGQRPVLFPSPYEGAAWSIISARRPAAQAAQVRAELATGLGASFDLAGRTLAAFPQPARLLELGDQFHGLNSAKLERLRGLARAALAGDLDVPRLHELGPELAHQELQRINGIGPFYAGLIVLRASGFADAILQVPERKGLVHTARFYGLPEPPDGDQFATLAERWRPFRTWATVLIRLAGDRGTTIAS
jgi:DNA-3-methyladenine glycosylase II